MPGAAGGAGGGPRGARSAARVGPESGDGWARGEDSRAAGLAGARRGAGASYLAPERVGGVRRGVATRRATPLAYRLPGDIDRARNRP